jgi:prevent-host-death family protein
MRAKTAVRPITYMKNHAADLIREVNETRSSVVVTQNGEARAVLMDIETFEQWRDSAAMMKIMSTSEADIAAGRVMPSSSVFEDARTMLKDLEGND